MEILCFYAGIAFAYANHHYPLLFIFIALYYRTNIKYIAWFLIAISWGLIHKWTSAPHGMPDKPVIQQAILIGEITSIPVVHGDTVQFTFSATYLNNHPINANIAMACYNHCPEIHAGQHWQLTAKIKKPRNLGNPGSFDYKGMLNARHIQWVGTTRRGSFKRLDFNSPSHRLLHFREHLCNKLALLNTDENTLGVMQALTLGANHHISRENWDLFRHTGTTHLIDISGAHIGLLAGVTFYIIYWICTHIERLCLYWPAQRTASIAALLVGIFYTIISGFAVPAQRAILACSLMLSRYFLNQRISIWQAWRYALLTVLIIDPHIVLSPGFYLSFIGVAIIVSVSQRFSFSGFRKTMALQLACLTGMMPLTLYWFSYGAVNGILANIVAIPWVELWIVPLCLIVTVLPDNILNHGIVFILKASISIFLLFLNWVDSFSAINLTFSFNNILAPLSLILALIVVLFLPLKQIIFPVLIMIIAALYPHQKTIMNNTAKIDVIDVGQGLSILIQTAHHALIYDTGVKFFQGSDMAKLAIIPYLKTLGIKKIDKVVISHPDIDHRGGLATLESNYPIQELIVDNPDFYQRGQSCHDYPDWEWDGVFFHFFAINQMKNKKNNHSCVLQVATRSGKVLLTGDIEQPAELFLASTYKQALASNIIIIPHHASKTSSTPAFISQVSPQYAVVSYGFDNRYHFPHHQALQTYQRRQIPILNTVDCGMITLWLDNQLKMKKPQCYLEQHYTT